MVEFRDVGTPACTRETERLLCVDGHRAAAVQEKKETRDTGGLTANNNHAGGVEDLRNHAVVKSQRPKRERAQTADRVVVKYLDRRARAPTVNRRPRSGVGGARQGVREYGAVNYHKVALKELAKTRQFSSDDPEQTSSGDAPSTRAARGGGDMYGTGRPVHAQHVEERAEAQHLRERGKGVQLVEAATPWSEHSSN